MKFRLLESTDGATMMGGQAQQSTPPANQSQQAQQNTSPADTNWLSAFNLEADIANDPSLKAIKDVPSLFKSYVHAQRKIGADKVVLPNKNSTSDEWAQLYHKLGLPTEFGKYEVKAEKSAMAEGFLEDFKKTAYEQKLLPEQANAIFDFVNNKVIQEQESLDNMAKTELDNSINGLKQEWGDAFELNVNKAKVAAKEFGGEDFQKYLNESGLGNNPALIKVFAKIGESFFKEDKFKESSSVYSMSPDQAQAKINSITGDFSGPYYNSMHPDHGRIVEEVAKLYKAMSKK